jgi:hypothetical protein
MSANDVAAENQAVLGAFALAADRGQPLTTCYRAGVDAWRSLHPDQSAPYAAKRAVAIMLAARVAQLALPADESIPSCGGM